MFVQLLNRHLQVASVEEARRLVKMDRSFWNVISIRGPYEVRHQLPEAKRVHDAVFPDIVPNREAEKSIAAHPEDVEAIFRFIQPLAGEPLLIHCLMGISLSSAIALGLIVQALPDRMDLDSAIDQLLAIRPKAVPNEHVLRLALLNFLPPSEAASLSRLLAQHERIRKNWLAAKHAGWLGAS